MTEELGRIEKPEAEQFKGERKLYLVPLLFAGPDAPEEFIERFDLYWQQVDEQITNQEARIGRVRRVYHESIALGGEQGLKVIETLSAPAHRIVEKKCQAGATLEATELSELAEECMDWERCLLMGFYSRKAAAVVSEFYRETSKQRYDHIASRIDETLEADEVGVLFIREGHMVQFPGDIEVFMVAPPALDAIHRWLRDRPTRSEPTGSEEATEDQPSDSQ